MEILVCVKQVPDDSVEISLDPKTGAPALDGVTPVVNAFDTYALEMAVRLKEAAGGEVTVLSIGDESVKNSLKNCLAVGADYAYLAANDAYQSADPEIIAKELKAAKEAIEEKTGKKFDIVFCGKETTDFASGQVGTILAKELSAPVTADVVDITAGEGKVTVKQETEEGYCMIESGLPCVVAVNKPEYDPRYPTIKSKMAARKKPIEELAAEEAGAAQVEVLRVYAPTEESRRCEDQGRRSGGGGKSGARHDERSKSNLMNAGSAEPALARTKRECQPELSMEGN
ncbi:MAG: electron transfer flavoprotein subunit beta/FixA family protein [Pilosibacter sp.]